MKCPFPGMDPFLEGQLWSDFHAEFITSLRARLMPKLLPDCVVNVEDSVYLMHDDEDPDRLVIPDVSIAESGEWAGGVEGGLAVMAKPVTRTRPKVRTMRRAYLVVRTLKGRDIVTVIEVLSPWNKSDGGRSEYLDKRDEYLKSKVNVVELDLLRCGRRLPTVEPLPHGDYFAFVCRAKRRNKIDVYSWPLRHPLPTIPIPLAPGDADVTLELQAAFAETYERAGYKYSVDYQDDVIPPLRPADQKWMKSLLKTAEKPK